MAEAMLLYRHLLDPNFATGKPKLAFERSWLELPWNLEPKKKKKKIRDFNCKKTATNCGNLCPPVAVRTVINVDPTPVQKTQQQNSHGSKLSENKKTVPPEANSTVQKPKLLSSTVNNGSGMKKERLDEAKYQEKFEVTKRKYLELSKGIIASRKKIKMIEFKDVPKESRLAATGMKKLIKPSRSRIN